MSSPPQAGPSVPKEEKEKKGFGRVLSRVKTVLKREKSESSTKRLSTVSTTKAAPASKSEPIKKRYVK